MRRARTRTSCGTAILPASSAPTRRANRASRAEIRENDYNLNIPRYVDTFEEEELVDIDEVKRNIESIEAELSQVQAQMAKYMEELGM